MLDDCGEWKLWGGILSRFERQAVALSGGTELAGNSRRAIVAGLLIDVLTRLGEPPGRSAAHIYFAGKAFRNQSSRHLADLNMYSNLPIDLRSYQFCRIGLRGNLINIKPSIPPASEKASA